MCLNLTALSIVKTLDGEFASVQLVFIRATVGLILILPFVCTTSADLQLFKNLKLQLLRGALAALALTFSFYAVAQLPLAFFITLNFTRPLLLMLLAFLFLQEHISGTRWLAGLIGLIGVSIAVNPGSITWSPAVGALAVAIVAGTLGVIVLRKLKGAPWQTVMLYYAMSIVVLTCIPALQQWHAPDNTQWMLLIVLAVFTQCAQFCFLRAHWLGDAGFLGPLGYVSLLLSIVIGLLFFNEVPSATTIIGAAIIVLASWILSRSARTTTTLT